MLVNYRTNEVVRAKNRAFSIFTRTKEKFEKAIEKARFYVHQNSREISDLTDKRDQRLQANQEMLQHISSMERSIKQIDHIIGE